MRGFPLVLMCLMLQFMLSFVSAVSPTGCCDWAVMFLLVPSQVNGLRLKVVGSSMPGAVPFTTARSGPGGRRGSQAIFGTTATDGNHV